MLELAAGKAEAWEDLCFARRIGAAL